MLFIAVAVLLLLEATGVLALGIIPVMLLNPPYYAIASALVLALISAGLFYYAKPEPSRYFGGKPIMDEGDCIY